MANNRFAGERDLASGWPVDAGNQIENGRFSGAVRSDQSDELPVLDREGEVGDAAQTAKLHRHSFELQQRGAHAGFRLKFSAPKSP